MNSFKTKKCIHCGKEININAKICKFCKKNVEERECPFCAELIPKYSYKCPSCEKKLYNSRRVIASVKKVLIHLLLLVIFLSVIAGICIYFRKTPYRFSSNKIAGVFWSNTSFHKMDPYEARDYCRNGKGRLPTIEELRLVSNISNNKVFWSSSVIERVYVYTPYWCKDFSKNEITTCDPRHKHYVVCVR